MERNTHDCSLTEIRFWFIEFFLSSHMNCFKHPPFVFFFLTKIFQAQSDVYIVKSFIINTRRKIKTGKISRFYERGKQKAFVIINGLQEMGKVNSFMVICMSRSQFYERNNAKNDAEERVKTKKLQKGKLLSFLCDKLIIKAKITNCHILIAKI